MTKLKTKIISSLTIAVMLSSSGSLAFADDNINTIKDTSGTGSISEIINKYEDYLKNTKDNKRFDKLLKEKSLIQTRNISDDLKNEIINNTIYKAKKQRLDGDSELSKIKDKKVKDRALWELKKANKTASTYRFLVKTNLPETELKETLAFFDKAEVLFLSVDSEWKNIFEINFPLKWKFANALANYIEAWELPDILFDKVEIIKPTLIKQIWAENYLSWETLSQTWWITKVWADKYQYSLSQKAKIKIWVIDTWIDYTHSELVGNLDINLGKNFVNTRANANDDHWHGTHVAWIIWAAVNAKWIFWVNSNTSLVPLKVLSADWYGSSYGIVDAINYAANNWIKVVNLSLGWDGAPSNDIICNAITNAKSKWTISVVAAWNENADVSAKVPAGCSDAITVWAVDSNLTKASFSNYWNEVDVSAPGVSIYSTYKWNTYASMAWTSMASPFVAGLVWAILSSTWGTYDSIKAALIANWVNVNSSVNIGKFISMPNTMKSLWVADDASYILPPITWTWNTSSGSTNTWTTNPPSTGTGITNSGTTNTGIIIPPANILPTLSLVNTKLSTNNYQITANATDSDGKIVWYNFFVNNILAYSGTTNIYKLAISQNTTVKVIAIDNMWWTAIQSLSLTYEKPVIANKLATITSTYKSYNKSYNLVKITAKDSDWYITNFDVYINNKLTYTYSNIKYTSMNLSFYTTKWSKTIKTVVKDNSNWLTTNNLIIK
jgi:subtilisin